MLKYLYFSVFFIFMIFICNQEDINVLKLKSELSDWAIEELIERQNHERRDKERERKQKWIILGVGTITTCIPLITAIMQSFQQSGCTCDPLQASISLNMTW